MDVKNWMQVLVLEEEEEEKEGGGAVWKPHARNKRGEETLT